MQSIPEELRAARWLQYLGDESRYWHKVAEDFAIFEPARAAAFAEQARRVEEQRAASAAKWVDLPKLPRRTMQQMLADVGASPLYIVYRNLSQVVHGSPANVERAMRKNFDLVYADEKIPLLSAPASGLHFGDFVTRADWASVHRAAGFAVTYSIAALARDVDMEREAAGLQGRYRRFLKASQKFEGDEGVPATADDRASPT